MDSPRRGSRQIVLFVEGHSERGEARQRTLSTFFKKWLDPKLPEMAKVGIKPVKFQGVSNYLDSFVDRLELYLDKGKANFAFGLLDLYGLPPDRIDLSNCHTVAEKVGRAEKTICAMVPDRFKKRFRQHFAVHELEAWLLAYPERWPPQVRDQIRKRPPEQVNFKEPPAEFLDRILRGRYKKTVYAKNIFRQVDPQVAIDKCPYLHRLTEDLLDVARRLQ